MSQAATQFDMRGPETSGGQPGPNYGTHPLGSPQVSVPQASGYHAAPTVAPQGVPGGVQPGMLLDGRYRVVQKIGSGGMGQVWEATHTVIHKAVALKVLQLGESVRPADVERLLREARATAAIDHPNVIDITDFGHTPDGSPYFVMERLTGRTLKDVIKHEGALDWHRTVKVLRQLSLALQAAHAKGVIHRDLKPENVFLVQPTAATLGVEELVKVIDFGIAKVTNLEAEAVSITQTGMVCGTPAFMSPEQARGDKIDLRTDIYALGCVAYQLLTAALPFDGQTSTEVLYKQLFHEPTEMRKAAPHVTVPADVEAFVFKCLRKDPDLRFQDAREVFEALNRLGTGQAPVAVPAENIAPPPAAIASFKRLTASPAQAHGLNVPEPGERTLDSIEIPTSAVGPITTYKRDTSPPAVAPAPKRGTSPVAIAVAIVGVVALGSVATLFVLNKDRFLGGTGTAPPAATDAEANAPSAAAPTNAAAGVVAEPSVAEIEPDAEGASPDSPSDPAADSAAAVEGGAVPVEQPAEAAGDAASAGGGKSGSGRRGRNKGGSDAGSQPTATPDPAPTAALPAPPESEPAPAAPDPVVAEPEPEPEPEPPPKPPPSQPKADQSGGHSPPDLRNPWG